MTEYFRIEGLETIDFDRQMVLGTAPVYCLVQNQPPADMSKPLTRAEIIAQLARLPLGVRGHALNRGMSMVTFPFSIQANSNAEMEQALHDLKRTLNEAQLYIESEGARGTRAVLRHKTDNAVETSYKTIYYGYLAEASARDVLGAKLKESLLEGLQLTLYMEPKWRPSTAIALGPNQIYCPGMEEDGNANGLADNWTLLNVPTATMESTIVLQGFYSQKLVTGAFVSRGIYSAPMVAPAATTTCIGYAWIARPAAGSDIIVQIWDNAGHEEAHVHYDAVGWPTATAKDGTTTFKRVAVSANTITAANTYVLRIYNLTDTGATYYVDKCFWKWGTTVIPDEWCDHWRLYNHYDTTESAAHVGHQNYFDVADLKGTDDARARISLEYEQDADYPRWADLIIGRRSRWPLANTNPIRDMHWLEAEDASKSNWAAAVLARCSAGACTSNAANTTGYVYWPTVAAPAAGYWTNHWLGRWDVFGMVYTDDIINTQYRLSYTGLGRNPWFYNGWVKQSTASTWQILYLGEVNFDRFISSDYIPSTVYIKVEYAKDAADTVSLDCIWLLPKGEPETRIHLVGEPWLETSYGWFFDRTQDFDCDGVEFATTTILGNVIVQGDEMILLPTRDQRLYFSAESVDAAPAPDVRLWEAHGAANPLHWYMFQCFYLPQYQTPLD